MAAILHSLNGAKSRALTKLAIQSRFCKKQAPKIKILLCQKSVKYVIKQASDSNLIKRAQCSNQVSYPDRIFLKDAYWDKVTLCQKSVVCDIKQGNDSKFSFFISDEKKKNKWWNQSSNQMSYPDMTIPKHVSRIKIFLFQKSFWCDIKQANDNNSLFLTWC